MRATVAGTTAPTPALMRSAASGHLVQLDALRAFAVLLVMIHHLLPAGYERWLPVGGWAGVRFFFVLSGFLITGILLKGRDLVEAGGQSTWLTLRRFYIRRFLRIIPLAYGVILVLAAFNAGEVRPNLGWHLAYLSNFRFIHDGYFHSWISHFWTLAVEEQFYLVWPWLILFVPRRLLMPLVLVAILVGPAYRYSSLAYGFSGIACEVAPFACLDTLAAGSLLALLIHRRPGRRLPSASLCAVLGWTGFAALMGMEVAGHLDWQSGGVFFAVRDSVLAVMAVGIIARAASGFRGFAGRLLAFRPLVYLGTISYGVYVYHMIVGAVTTRVFRYWGVSPALAWSGWVDMTLTVLVAAASWHLFERPLNDLKHRFPYERKAGEGGGERGLG